MIFFSVDSEGQLGWLDDEEHQLDLHTSCVVINPDNLVTETQTKRNFVFNSYSIDFGLRSCDSTIKKPTPKLLSQEKIMPNMNIGFFRRYKHHKEDPYITVGNVTATYDGYFEMTIVLKCRQRNIKYMDEYRELYSFLKEGSKQLSSRNPKPFNRTMKTHDEVCMFVRSGGRYRTISEKNETIELIDDSMVKSTSTVMFARFNNKKPVDKNNDVIRMAHGIPFSLINKQNYTDHFDAYMKKIPEDKKRNLILIGLTTGEVYLGTVINSRRYFLTYDNDEIDVVNVPKYAAENVVVSAKPILLDKFFIEKQKQKEVIKL